MKIPMTNQAIPWVGSWDRPRDHFLGVEFGFFFLSLFSEVCIFSINLGRIGNCCREPLAKDLADPLFSRILPTVGLSAKDQS